MKKEFDEKMKTYAEEYLAGDRTHEDDFMKGIEKVVWRTAQWKHFRFNDTDGRIRIDFSDLYQETAEAGLLNLKSYDKNYSFCSWIHVICRNIYYKHIKKDKNEVISLDQELTDQDGRPLGTLADTIDSGIDVEKNCVDADVRGRVFAGLQSIRPRYREALELCYLDGMNRKDAANIMGVNEGVLNNCVHLGTKSMKKYCLENEIEPEL